MSCVGKCLNIRPTTKKGTILDTLVPKLLWPDLIASTKYRLFLTEIWVLSQISSPTHHNLDLAAAFPRASWLIRGWRLGVQRAQVSSSFGGPTLKWHRSSQTFCSLFLAFRNDKGHLCCCYQRVLCICQCNICHVIWHCTDIMAALHVDITVFPPGGGSVQGGAKGSPV